MILTKSEKTDRKIKNMKGIAAISRAYLHISRTFELDIISRIYLRELINVVHCEACAIILINKDRIKVLAERDFSKCFGA